MELNQEEKQFFEKLSKLKGNEISTELCSKGYRFLSEGSYKEVYYKKSTHYVVKVRYCESTSDKHPHKRSKFAKYYLYPIFESRNKKIQIQPFVKVMRYNDNTTNKLAKLLKLTINDLFHYDIRNANVGLYNRLPVIIDMFPRR